jgi:hypothetical protein
MSFLVWLLAVLDISLSNECLFPFSWLDCIRWKRIFSCMASFLAIISQDTLRASINKYSTVIRVCGLRIGDPAFNELILDIPPHRLLQHTRIVILSHSIFKFYPSISINSLDLEIPNPKPLHKPVLPKFISQSNPTPPKRHAHHIEIPHHTHCKVNQFWRCGTQSSAMMPKSIVRRRGTVSGLPPETPQSTTQMRSLDLSSSDFERPREF